ncbi:MAG: SH3 domain-containing protein [Anaerolineales bacterium]
MAQLTKSLRKGWTIGALTAWALGGCTWFGPPPEPTLNADQVLSTAAAIAEQTRNAATPTFTLAPASPRATVPLETGTPTPTGTPTSAVVTADYNANVRSGPGENYPVIDVFLQGETAAAVGKYDDPVGGRWWSIHRLAQGLDGWVWGGAATFSGDDASVPFLVPPATPTKTPVP